MPTTIETIHKEVHELKKDITIIKSILREDFELSDHAKAELKEARETPESEYTELE
jgi:DNA gyrase/topoisomerase IV subunit A